MEEPTLVMRHIESFVDSKCSSTQQAASLNAIASVLKNGELDIEQLVREMGMYLINTDSIVRARGILLLGELLACLGSKPLDGAALHSLICFFTGRLADWKALRGALLGCLALVRRKSNVGMVTGSDAKAVAQAYLENLQVQSLAQYDRKLCFELMECLLECYPEVLASLGDELIYGICAAIDEEKDPQCLLRTFHIIEVMGKLFPGPSDPLASFAEDIFEILGCYFPIHFTHPKGEDVDVKRDELSRALMLAFSSTPLFEPFAIPLLLEKLSSSLTSAKIDSLKYLAHCTLQYGADRMEKHVGAIWSSLKEAICASQEPTLSFAPHSLGELGFLDNEIATEALTVLQKLLLQNNDSLLRLIIDDHGVKMVFDSIIGYKSYTDIPLESKRKLIAIGRVLSVSAKTSIISCNEVFESFFPHLMDTLGISGGNSSEDWFPNEDHVLSKKLNFGALYLCIELLVACRNLVLTSKDLMSNSSSMNMLRSFSTSLTKELSSTLVTKNEDTQDADIYIQVQGLQILATFSGLISNGTFEKILMTLTTIVTVDFNKPLLWKLAMKAIVNIGFYVDRSNESEKELSYIHIVVEKMISSMYLDDASMPFPLKLEAISDIGTSGKKPMLKVVQGLEEAIFANLLEVNVHGNLKSADTGAGLLECYSDKLLPWIHKTGGFEEVMLRFAVNIWNQFDKWPVSSEGIRDKELLDATTKSLKLVVANCSEESQNVVMQKAYDQFSSSTFFQTMESTSDSVPVQQLEGLLLTEGFSSRDEWLISLFSSVVIAARPQTHIPCIRVVLRLFMTTLLKGYAPAAQAIGSTVNKLGVKSDVSSGCTLEEAMDIIFKTRFCSNGSELCVMDLCLGVASGRLLRVHAITGLAWIGKGLLLRGHEKVKDITLVFLECLQSSGEMTASPLEQDGHFPEMKCAADAFHILMSDSEVCLNKKFHAVIRPLYKQRYYSIMVPILQSLILKSDSVSSRPMLYRAFAHVISHTPISVILSDAKKIIPILLVSLPSLSKDISDKDMVYNLLLVLSGMLTDKNGNESVLENAHVIVNCLTGLVAYPHMTIVRETAIQCLVAVSGLAHTRIYPMRTQVLQAVSKALDDPKRVVRQEAVRCRRAWSMLSGTWFR